MALKLLQRLQLLGQPGKHLYPLGGPASFSGVLSAQGGARQSFCVACLWTSAGRCIQRYGCKKLQSDCGRMCLPTTARDPPVWISGSAGLHGDAAVESFRLTQLHGPGPTGTEGQAFQERLSSCSSSGQVLRLLRTAEIMSDTMATAALHRVADLEQDNHHHHRRLKDPTVLEQDTLRALCFQLEQDSSRLTEAGLASALLACTRLYLEPRSSLVVRLVSESQERLDGERLSMGPLCSLGRAVLALEGPGCRMLAQLMEQVQKQEPSGWSLTELTAVYGLLRDGMGEAGAGRYQDLLSAMHEHAVSVIPRIMQPSDISEVLSALAVLNQTHAMPLVIRLCKQAVRHVPRFSDAELVLMLDALMHFGLCDPNFVEAMERYVPKMAFTSHPETVTKVMQYFGRRNILSPPVFDAVAESFVYRADDYSTSQIAQQIMPFGKLGYLPPNAGQLFRKVESTLHSRFSHFQPRMLLSLLHTCILVGRHPVNFVSKVFNDYFLQQLQEEGTGMDVLVLGQLTQLYMTMKLECPFYMGPNLLPKYRVKSFRISGLESLESRRLDKHLDGNIKHGLEALLGAPVYFASKVLTPYCYTLDVEMKLDEEGYVLPATHGDDVHKRIAICIDGPKRFSVNTRQLLGKEVIKQRQLRLLGYQVVQIPYYEFEELHDKTQILKYLHKKIFPHSYRLSW